MQLEELPGWTWGKTRDGEFGKKAQAWARFVRVHKRVPTTKSTASREEKSLASWAGRVQKAKNINKLPEQQVLQMEKTHGWVWKTGSSTR
eukprot:43065-Eustigmatos_ZCMA.PRE.1